MRSFSFAILILAVPLFAAPEFAAMAHPDDDGIVILSVTPRDPGVKPEILLTPAKKIASASKSVSFDESSVRLPETAQPAQKPQGSRPSSP